MTGFFSPRPLRRGTELSDWLIAVELPECGCKTPCVCFQGRDGFPTFCPGVTACDECPKRLCSHGRAIEPDLIPIEEWSLLLMAYDRKGYSDPPLPTPKLATTRAARSSLLMSRARKQQALRHPDDVTIFEEELEHFQITAILGKVQAHLYAAWHDEDDASEAMELDLDREVDPDDPVAVRALELDRLVARAIEARKSEKAAPVRRPHKKNGESSGREKHG